MTSPLAVAVPARTLPELARAHASSDAGRVALRADGAGSLTLGQWLARSRQLAAGLDGQGMHQGDRVALAFGAHDWISYAVAVLAVYLSGAVVVAMAPGLTPAEVSRRCGHCGVSGVLHGTGATVPRTAGWAIEVGPSSAATRVSGAAAPRAAAFLKPDGLAEIIYTSGTTGPAKPVAVTHANLTFGQAAGGRLPGAGQQVLAPVPLGTNAAHSAIMVALTGGSTVHVLTRPDPQSVAAALAGLPIDMAILPAPLATRLVVSGLLARRRPIALTAVMLGSAPVPSATAQRLAELLPEAAISVGYGSTEAAPASTHQTVTAGTDLAGRLGRPRQGTEVEVRGEDGRPVAAGEVGEIWLRSGAPQRSYYGLDAAGTFSGGWSRMDDLGSLAEDGSVRFFDRAADAIVLDGTRVSAFSVEDALHWHPAVADVAVVAVPGSARGQLAALVELTEPVPDRELAAFAARRLAKHEVPDLILGVSHLPRGGLGKVIKRRVRESLAGRDMPDRIRPLDG